MKAEFREDGPVLILALQGDLDAEARLQGAVGQQLDAGHRSFVFDLRKVTVIDSAGMGEVIACYKQASARGGAMRLVVNEKLHRLLRVLGLHEVLPMFRELEEAKGSFPDEAKDEG